MSFNHLSLAAVGSAFVAIPILLHLLMRRKPKHFVFPALRFVQRRRIVNQRRLQIRHILLLMLRCLAIGAIAVALARPFVPSSQMANGLLLALLGIAALAAIVLALVSRMGDHGAALGVGLATLGLVLGTAAVALGWSMRSSESPALFSDDQSPVAAAMVFDVSARMAFQHKNRSRLEQAQALGTWLLGELPSDSDLAIVDSGSDRATFSVDRTTANSAIESLQVNYNTRPLLDAVSAAIELVNTSQQERKEVYILTDLTQRSWASGRQPDLRELISSEEPVLVYLIDVGIEDAPNLFLDDVRLSGGYLTEGQPLRLDVAVNSSGQGGSQQLELYVEKPDPTRPVIVDGKPLLPERTLRSRRSLELADDGSAQESFLVRGLEFGTHHGEVRLAGSDGLEIDNQRYFTVEVIRPWPVLVTGAAGVLPDLVSALSPAAPNSFQPQFVAIDQLNEMDLGEYAAIGLLDPSALSPALWRALGEFVSEGGGLGIFLGREARPLAAFNEGESQRVLPGKLQRQWRAGGQPIYVRLGSAPHPAIDGLRARASTIPWSDFPVFRHWVFSDVDADATTVLRLTNNHPLLLESAVGAGRVLTMTTPISDPLNVPGRPEWNRLPTGPDPWPYFVLVNDAFRYLVQSGETRLNYAVGEPGLMSTVEFGANPRLQVFHPASAWQDVAASGDTLNYSFTDTPGIYRVRNANTPAYQRGFSVNLPAASTSLARVDAKFLDGVFGSGNYQVARDKDQINRRVGEARRGRDFYPWILLLFAVVLGVEFVLANRFYPVSKTQTAVA